MAITEKQDGIVLEELLQYLLKQCGVYSTMFDPSNRFESDTYQINWNEKKNNIHNKLQAIVFQLFHCLTYFTSKSTLKDIISTLSDLKPTQDDDIVPVIVHHELLRRQQRPLSITSQITKSVGPDSLKSDRIVLVFHDEKRFYKSVESVALTMHKNGIMIHGRVTKYGQSGVCFLLNPNVSFTPKQLQILYDGNDSALKSLSCHLKDYFNADEVKALSGRTPLETERTGKFETVFIANDAMRSKQQRCSSFARWPYSSITNVPELVEAGFYSTDCSLQIVKCFSCGLLLRVSELNGRGPLDVHRERSQDCQFLHSENIRERTISNSQLQRFEPLTTNNINVNGISRDQISQYSSPISKTNNDIDYVTTESDLSNNPRRRQNIIESQVGEVAERIQNNFSLNPQEQLYISQPSDEVEDGTEIHTNLGEQLVLSGTNQNQQILTYNHSEYSPGRDTIFSQQNSANNGGHIHEQIEGATAAISNFVLSPSSLAQDSSTPPPRNPQYEQENARRESFNAWNGRHDIDSLVEAGLFFTGDQDIVRCFHCDIGLAEWNREDDPWQEHARHSHECHFLLRIKGHAYVNDVQREWSKVYSPKRPDLSHVDSRLDTFHNWPRNFVVQTPEQLAIAGFYYAGMTDTARCHYCDGGLREWEPGDIPWVEHAKWFPHCKFVLKIKGLPFIQQCIARRNEVLEDPVPNNTRAENEALNRLRAPISNEEKNRAREENNPLYTAAAQSVIAMGYTTAVVTKCINAYIASTGQRNFGATDLMDIILDKEDEDGKLSSDGETGGNETNDDGFRFDGPALLKINETLKQEQLCIDCRNRGRQILFQPCGHLLLCNICAQKCTHCLRCNTMINSRVKIYMS